MTSSKSLDPIVQPHGDSEAGAETIATNGPKKADAISQLCTFPFSSSKKKEEKKKKG
jgi:hypothetical protein